MTVLKRPAPPAMANSAPSLTTDSTTAPSIQHRPSIAPMTTLPKRPSIAPPVLVAPTLPMTEEVNATYGRKRPSPIQAQNETSQPAPKPVVSAGQPAHSGQLGADTSDTDGDEEDQEFTGQISRIQLHDMNVMDRFALWKRLNRGNSTKFVPTLRAEEVPKQMVRETVPLSAKPAGKGVMWCCYCGDWTIFAPFAYTGNDKCIGCSISTKDFYNRTANKLWNEDV